MPSIVRTVAEMQTASRSMTARGHRLGLVPTMGFLHSAHLGLVGMAQRHADAVAVSIYLNPTQFGPSEDYQTYPRDFEQDLSRLTDANVDIVFAPTDEEMYPDGYDKLLEVGSVGDHLCGASRPGHFAGVATVVARLFSAVEPDVAVFGQKDAQQIEVIRAMVREQGYPVQVLAFPTCREPDGLAMSSRNVYLNEKERRDASVLFGTLQEARHLVRTGEQEATNIRDRMKERIRSRETGEIDYVEVVNPESMQPIRMLQGEALAAVAVQYGRARLIDNLRIGS